ncbi:MAG TPA: FtsX-like permease family protein [Polyangiales bacterium]|nr:FtsX-like permease family protein [Polyangiales bacterium]
MFTRLMFGMGSSIAWSVIALMTPLTRLLSGTRLGSLLQTVSLSRVRLHPLRTSASAIGITLGVAVLAAVSVVNHSIMSSVNATVEELAGKADLQITAGSSGFAESTLTAVRELPEVASATPMMEQVASAFGPNGQRERVMMLGIDLLGSEESNFRSYNSADLDEVRRDQLGFVNATHNVILGRELARRLGLEVHDKIRIAVGDGVQDFEIWALVDLDGGSRAFGGSFALMYYPAMQAAFARGTNIDRIDVALAPGAKLEQVRAALQRRLGDGLTIQPPGQRADRLKKMLQSIHVGLIMTSLIALIAGACLVFNTSAIGVIQRRHELGVMRALGATRGQLVQLLTTEAVLVGTIGSALGILLGLGMSSGMLKQMSSTVSKLYLEQGVTEVHIDPIALSFCFALGVIITAVAARLATQRVGEVQPVEALSSASELRLRAPEKALSRVELLGLGLLLSTWPLLQLPVFERIPYGPLAAMLTSIASVQAFVPRLLALTRRIWPAPGRGAWSASTTLAVDSVFRDVGRSGAMAASVIAALALVVSISTFDTSFMGSLNDWIEQSLAGDLLVTSGSSMGGMSSRNTPLAEGLGAELLSIPNVAHARPYRTANQEFRGRTVKLISTDIALWAEHARIDVLEGETASVVEQVKQGAIAVSENFSRAFDVHRGDKLTLTTAEGARSFVVAGVMVDYSSDLGVIIVDRATYVAHWADSRVDTYELYLTPGASPEAVRAQIDQRLSDRFDLFVLTNRDFRAEVVQSVGQVSQLMRVLEIVTLLVAALGLMTTVLASVMNRIREVGVFRAIGMLRRQVARMVMLESIFIGYIGGVFGILLGGFAGYILLEHVMVVELGWHFAVRVPVLALGAILLLLPLLAALAGYLPARKAAGLQLRDALDYE